MEKWQSLAGALIWFGAEYLVNKQAYITPVKQTGTILYFSQSLQFVAIKIKGGVLTWPVCQVRIGLPTDALILEQVQPGLLIGE